VRSTAEAANRASSSAVTNIQLLQRNTCPWEALQRHHTPTGWPVSDIQPSGSKAPHSSSVKGASRGGKTVRHPAMLVNEADAAESAAVKEPVTLQGDGSMTQSQFVGDKAITPRWQAAWWFARCSTTTRAKTACRDNRNQGLAAVDVQAPGHSLLSRRCRELVPVYVTTCAA
jgi:hypothetical protein